MFQSHTLTGCSICLELERLLLKAVKRVWKATFMFPAKVDWNVTIAFQNSHLLGFG